MYTKLNELKELGDLLKSGHISQEEFEGLKKDLLNGKSEIGPSIDNIPVNQDLHKEKIVLKSYENASGEKIDAPQIEYLNFNDISDSDAEIIKSFLKLKFINREEVTNDEIRLGEKLFTPTEIIELSSEKTGFNYPLSTITSLVCLGLAIYFLSQSVATILLGAGSMLILSFITAITSLFKIDATKLDRRCSMTSLIGVIISFYVVYEQIF